MVEWGVGDLGEAGACCASGLVCEVRRALLADRFEVIERFGELGRVDGLAELGEGEAVTLAEAKLGEIGVEVVLEQLIGVHASSP